LIFAFFCPATFVTVVAQLKYETRLQIKKCKIEERMKKECNYTRRMLPRYLKGHLFLPQQKRVERHLAGCAVCRSQFDAHRRINETQEFLHYLSPEEGIAGRVKAGASRLSGVRRLLFRPLWLAAIVIAAIVLHVYVIRPFLHDPDLEKLDAGPAVPPAAEVKAGPVTVPTPTPPAASGPSQQQTAAPKTDPLVITITLMKENEKEGIGLINDAMQEHALLKSMRFSDKAREISGSLTTDELTTFFGRIRGAGKITYKRSRLAAAHGELLPFVMKLQVVSAPPQATAETPVSGPVDRPADKPAERPAPKPAEKAAEPAAERPSPEPAERPAPSPQQGQ
jgi:hypothetical protein